MKTEDAFVPVDLEHLYNKPLKLAPVMQNEITRYINYVSCFLKK